MKKPNIKSGPGQSGYGIASLAVFLTTLLVFLVMSTLLDAQLGKLSLSAQRWVGAITLVVPASIGAIIGIIGLFQPNRKKTLPLLGFVLNAIFALFFAFVLSFAG